jgi:hypothetical protein
MKMLLPILWFVTNVLSFNTFSNNYEQKKNGDGNANKVFPAQKSANKISKIYFLTEAFEENVEEDADGESDLDFFGASADVDFNITQIFVTTHFFENLNGKIDCASSPIAYSQAKFILFQKIVI